MIDELSLINLVLLSDTSNKPYWHETHSQMVAVIDICRVRFTGIVNLKQYDKPIDIYQCLI